MFTSLMGGCHGKDTFAAAEWGKWYPQFVPLAESSHREIYTVVE